MPINYSQTITPSRRKAKTKSPKFIPGHEPEGVVANSDGMAVFEVMAGTRLDRFLILGTEGGSHYANERKLTQDNARDIITMIKTCGLEVLKRTVQVSHEGLAPSNDPAIFVMALLCKYGSEEVLAETYKSITKVCRTGTHLFTFVQNITDLERGWGRGLRRGVANFYSKRPADKLALQLMKYRQRNGWTQADVIRMCHPEFPAGAEGMALRVLDRKVPKGKKIPKAWTAFEEVQLLTEKKDVKKIVRLIDEHDLPWEALATEVLNFPEIWEALLPRVGYAALLRNLSRLTKIGLISAHGFDGTTKLIAERFADADELQKSRLHPIKILNGLKAYGLGYSVHRGGMRAGWNLGKEKGWDPSQKIMDVLDDAFYAAFKNVEPTGKNFMLALDVSGSMSGDQCGKTALSPREASTAMALVTMNVEPNTYLMGFSNRFIELKITKKMRLDAACKYTESLPFESTDCSLPMRWAVTNKAQVDAFCVYTDSETNYNSERPSDSLAKYRAWSKRESALVTVGMVANEFTIADPKDPRQLDVVGFSLDTPQAISAFVAGVE